MKTVAQKLLSLGRWPTRTHMDTVCLFTFAAKPSPSNAEFADTREASVNAWVSHSDEAIAEQIARDAITEQGWQVGEVEQFSLVSRDTYADDPELLGYLAIALEDGIFLAYHCWVPDGKDSDDDKASAS